MLQDLPPAQPRRRVLRQQPADHILGLVRDRVPHGGLEAERALADVLHHLLRRRPVEGRAAAQDVVDDGAEAPEIAHRAVRLLQDLGRHVQHRADRRGQHLAGLEAAGEAEVDELQGRRLQGAPRLEDEVLGLEVPVDDALAMHVRDGAGDLPHQQRCLGLCDLADLDYAVEELSARAQVHDEIVRPGVLKRLDEPDDVLVV
mmetsp:Transcript_115169/g.321933  ORF Transcript_115169/g.321933 Transcript_115169/m.321933 type:complete len:202 (+) Transcript_115169:141-746(+)